MIEKVRSYYQRVKHGMSQLAATGPEGHAVAFEAAIENAVGLFLAQRDRGGHAYFIGNGASAAISGHQAADFTKAGRVPSHCFHDAALLTCMSNDYSYAEAFERCVRVFMKPADLLVAISSSGESENIVRAAQAARDQGVKVLTLTGFKPHNRLRKLGDINFYVPVEEYGHVEIIHHSVCHCILDLLIEAQKAQVKGHDDKK